MKPDLVEKASALLVERIGIHVKAEIRKKGDEDHLVFWPGDYDQSESFTIRFSLGLHSAESVFEPGRFSGAVIRSLAKASPQGLVQFAAFAAACEENKIRVTVKINGVDFVSETALDAWPKEVASFGLRIFQQHLDFDRTSDLEVLALVDALVVPAFGMMSALLGTEELRIADESDHEGAVSYVRATRYERSRNNRKACLMFHGIKCKACGFDFFKSYGETGKGFIEVHHVERVADYGSERIVDPIKDLIPLCPNCHAIAHMQIPPFLVDEIQSMLRREGPQGDASP